jgi:hypothetical protein
MKKCCISLGINSDSPLNHPKPTFQDFSKGLNRIQDDLNIVGFGGEFISWDQSYPDGCPKQNQAHGAFKPFCFYEALNKGYDLVLWLDASIKIIAPLDPIFKYIEKDGYLIFQEDHSLGEFCKDDALVTLGIEREASFNMPCCWSCVLGLNLKNLNSQKFLKEWMNKALDGVTFPGPKWSGVFGWPQIASKDCRVKGHRHDQTAASAIALKYGMNKWKSKLFFHHFFENEREFVRSYQEVFS